MIALFFEANLDGLVEFLILIMVGPAIVLAIIGGILRYNKKKKAAKILFILAALYLLISLGICGALVTF